MITAWLFLYCAGVALAQSKFTCPDDGFFSDPLQCDKYYDCYRSQMTEKICPDGLVFDHTLGPKVEQCNYPFLIDCGEATQLQPAQPSGIECPRQNGYFEHEDAANCEEYYECTNGIPVLRACHSGLVFDEFTGTCVWAHTGLRTGCGIRVEVLEDGFSCPNETQNAANGHSLDHTRHVKPDDCRQFYICHEGKYPRLSGCPEGTVFNDISLECDLPENVPGCENYYEGQPADKPAV